MLNILSWIITGLVVGLIARMLMPGRQSMGMLKTTLLGIVGAFAGGLIVSLATGNFNQPTEDMSGWYWPGWLMSIVGGVLVLWAYIKLAGPSDRTLGRTI